MTEHKGAPPPEFPTDRDGNPVNLMPTGPVLWMTVEAQEARKLRIEALRAAALITSSPGFFKSGDHAADTFGLAKQFAAYLESGE